MHIFTTAAQQHSDPDILESVITCVHSLSSTGGYRIPVNSDFPESKANSYLIAERVVPQIVSNVVTKGNSTSKVLAAKTLYNISKDGTSFSEIRLSISDEQRVSLVLQGGLQLLRQLLSTNPSSGTELNDTMQLLAAKTILELSKSG